MAGRPFPIGVFSAKKKPTNLTGYLEEFVQEMQETVNEGVEYLGKKWKVAVRAVVCDYPDSVCEVYQRSFCLLWL